MKKFLVLSLLLLFSCSAYDNPYPLNENAISPEKSIVSISFKHQVGLSESPHLTYFIHNRNNPAKKIRGTNKYDTAIKTDFGWINTFELSPGDYEIYNFYLMFSINYIEEPTVRFSIPFKVEKGKNVYLGELELSNYQFYFSDKWSRDKEVIFKKYPWLEKEAFTYQQLACAKNCSFSVQNAKPVCEIVNMTIELNPQNRNEVEFTFGLGSLICTDEEAKALYINEVERYKKKMGYSKYKIIKIKRAPIYEGKVYIVSYQ